MIIVDDGLRAGKLSGRERGASDDVRDVLCGSGLARSDERQAMVQATNVRGVRGE